MKRKDASREDVERATAILMKIPGVRRVVEGSFVSTAHRSKSGSVKFVAHEATGALVRAYSRSGMTNLHVHSTDVDRLQRVLNGKSTVPAAAAAASAGARMAPTPEEAPKQEPPPPAKPVKPVPFIGENITRERKKQPVYPATPAPMKAANPVMETEVNGRLLKVTPEIAANWLERNTKNRRLRDDDVLKYASDMKAGRWLPGGAIIKFDVDGNIINGQHVLWAVLESGSTVDLYVLSGLDRDVFLVEDDHAKRTLTDVIRIKHPGYAVGALHAAVASMLRMSIEWAQGRPAAKIGSMSTRQEQINFLMEHADAINFAAGVLAGKGLRGIKVAPVLAAVARAWYTQDRNKLEQFAYVLRTGMMDTPQQSSAIVLRNYLIASVALSTVTSQAKQDTYRKTERAIKAFMDGEILRQIKAIGDELFPLPEEKSRRKR